MYNTHQDLSGDVFVANGERLSDVAISNMITILTNHELGRMFTYEETEMIKMAVKTNIANLAASTISKVSPGMAKYEQENDEIGKTFR